MLRFRLITCVDNSILLLTPTDTEAPKFVSCPVNQSLETNPGLPTAVAVWKQPFASDNSEDKPEISCDRLSESEFTIGQTLVTCKVVDSGGNNDTCSFQIDVKGT